MQKILIVEDDTISIIICFRKQYPKQAIPVEQAFSGTGGKAALNMQEHSYAPGVAGFDVAGTTGRSSSGGIRKRNLPVIVLTAKDSFWMKR